MESYYVRIWNSTFDRVFGWLGIKDSYAACVPAGVYSNPLKLPGVLPIQWRPVGTEGAGILAVPREDGDYGLGGKDTNGVNAYWHWLDGAYTLNLDLMQGRHLQSPVPGSFCGTLSQTRNGRSFALHSDYSINNDVFGLSFRDAAAGPTQLFSKQEVYLDFTTEELLFEFVPVSAFDPAIYSYAPLPRSKYDNWEKLETSTWMGDLIHVIGQRPLAELVIPGSHDAASWDIPALGGSQRSQTQSRDIYGQLRAGSRYLDLRFRASFDGVWRGNHGLDDTAATLGPVLDDINRFLVDNPKEIIVISLLPTPQPTEAEYLQYRAAMGSGGVFLPSYKPADDIWDVVLTKLGARVFPRTWREKDNNGVETEYYHFVKNINPSGLLALQKNIVLFSWGRPPGGTVVLSGAMRGQRRGDYVWAATSENTDPSPGHTPWKASFAAATRDGYDPAFDLGGIWINGYSTTANDVRLVLDSLEPPTGGPLWMMHVNAPAFPGAESIKTKAERIQTPLARLVQEDPSMTAKLNFVNLDFVGDHPDMIASLIQANLLR